MPSGDKSSYTNKQKRQAEHIEASYEHRGVPRPEAEARAWATVNKESGGGKLSGAGRRHADNREATPAARDRPAKTAEQRSAVALKGWVTRRKRRLRR